MPAMSFSALEILPSLLNKTKTQTIREGKPRFKVGDKVQLMWKQRTSPKDSAFCIKTGERIFDCKCGSSPHPYFLKRFSTAEITEVFEIEMWTGNDVPLITGYTLKQTEELARLDGFPEKSIKTPDVKYADFWHFFFKYDLSTPKRFAVYRWKWL